MYKDDGAGLSGMVKGGGAGLGDAVKGEGVRQGQDTGDIDASYSYPLVDPRLEEAHDDSTVAQCTGADRSIVQPLSSHISTPSSHLIQLGKGVRCKAGQPSSPPIIINNCPMGIQYLYIAPVNLPCLQNISIYSEK